MDIKLYDSNDMVRVGCNDCKGCSSCCQGMGESILLDPYDIWQLETNLNTTFTALMQEKIELHVEDGLILPNLKMQGASESCGFLNQEGRCNIHAIRPGLCRLFPLGRNYTGDRLQYFVLENVCPHLGHSKIKVKKWLEISGSKRYEGFLTDWHSLRKSLQEKIVESGNNSELMKQINMNLLHIFYEMTYLPCDFYEQFESRMQEMLEIL